MDNLEKKIKLLDLSSKTYDFSLMFSTPFKALHFAIILDYKQHCDCFLLNVVGYNVYHAATNQRTTAT